MIDFANIQPNQIIDAFFRSKKVILLLFLLGFTFSVFHINNIPSTYKATAWLLFKDSGKDLFSLEELRSGSSNTNTRIFKSQTDQYLNTQYTLLRSRQLIEDVIIKLSLDKHPEINPGANASEASPGWIVSSIQWLGLKKAKKEVLPPDILMQQMIDRFKRKLNIEPVKDTTLVRIHFFSKDPHLAAEVANQLGRRFIELNAESRKAEGEEIQQWMQTRLIEIEAQLKHSEEALQNYRDAQNLIDIQGVLTVNNEEIAEMTKSLVQAKKSLTASTALYHQILAIDRSNNKDYSNLPAVVHNPLIEELKTLLVEQEKAFSKIKKRYGPQHPSYIAALSSTESLRTMIDKQTVEIVEAARRTYDIDRNRVASLNNAITDAKENIRDINRKQFGLEAVERKVETNQKLYDMMLKTLEESSLAASLKTPVAKPVDPAFVPQNPVKPKKKLLLLIAFIVNFMFAAAAGVSYCFFRLYRKSRNSHPSY